MTAPVKCVVWDLDETLWQGTLLEGAEPAVLPANRDLVRKLDEHGVLQSIASRNDPEPALAALDSLGLSEYFVAPQIGWSMKSDSVARIAETLGIALDSVLFVDDNEFERLEVADRWPQVRCLHPAELPDAVVAGWVLPASVSAEARRRRSFYQAEQRRREEETQHGGSREEFLKSLGMRLVVRSALAADLTRAAELTQRTHQLNTTGITFDEVELHDLVEDPGNLVLVAELTDRFGDSGIVGLAVVAIAEQARPTWDVLLLLMSCRVMGRNLGTTMIAAVVRAAHATGAGVRAHFRLTERNRQMRRSYRLLGFTPDPAASGQLDGTEVLVLPDASEPGVPAYVDLVLTGFSKTEGHS